jgi:hypothetical protein
VKRFWIFFVLIFVGLALLVPFSSQHPDPVQRLLGLSGGVESAARALAGMIVVVIAALALATLLKKPRPPNS